VHPLSQAPITDGIKQALVGADERSTTHVFRTLNNTERVFKNPVVMKVGGWVGGWVGG
jgi:nitronate monooxygenase